MKRSSPLAPNARSPRPSPYSRDPWRLVECPATGLVYLENPPAYEELEENFAWEKTFEIEKKRRQSEEPVLYMLSEASKKARRLLRGPRKIATLPLAFLDSEASSTLTVVDVGAGDGVQTAVLAEHLQKALLRPVRPIAVEISKAQAAAANSRLKDFQDGFCLQASALEGVSRLQGAEAELVLLGSFLEHELHPVELLAACRGLLAPKGIALIKVPNFACWNRRIRGRKWCGFRFPDHVNYFTPRTLRLAIEKAGLKVVRMKLRDRLPFNDNMYAVAALPREDIRRAGQGD